MFEKPLKYSSVGTETGDQGTTVHLFSFKTPKKRHIITEVHIHVGHPVAVIKFYDKAHRLSEKRFSLMSGSREAVPIIRTAIEIMLKLYESNPFLSFAFMGATDLDNPSTIMTKRFRVYVGIMERFFSDANFLHRKNPMRSLYILLNRDYIDPDPDKAKDIFQMLEHAYPKED